MRSVFGWSLPPGCSMRDIDGWVDGPCAVCAKPADVCVCPECPVCGSNGDPACYADDGHGLRLNREQAVSRQMARIALLEEGLAEEKLRLGEIARAEAEADWDLRDIPDPWR